MIWSSVISFFFVPEKPTDFFSLLLISFQKSLLLSLLSIFCIKLINSILDQAISIKCRFQFEILWCSYFYNNQCFYWQFSRLDKLLLFLYLWSSYREKEKFSSIFYIVQNYLSMLLVFLSCFYFPSKVPKWSFSKKPLKLLIATHIELVPDK